MYKFRKTLNTIAIGLVSFGLMAQPTLPPCDAGFEASVETIVFDLAGQTTNAVSGDPANTTITICNAALADASIDLISWDDFVINPEGPSWCSEPEIVFLDPSSGLLLTPGGADAGVGPCAGNPYSSGGDLSLAANGISPILADAAGCVTIEIAESFDDAAVDPDATIVSGLVTITQEICVEVVAPPPPPPVDAGIPTMGEWGLICLAFLLMIFGITSVKQRNTSVEGAL